MAKLLELFNSIVHILLDRLFAHSMLEHNFRLTAVALGRLTRTLSFDEGEAWL